MILYISVFSVVISPFSFLILLIWFFSVCFLMSLANGLSVLFIFSKNKLLALLIFTMVSLVSFAFISALSFKISFLLLTLGFFVSSFSSYFYIFKVTNRVFKITYVAHIIVYWQSWYIDCFLILVSSNNNNQIWLLVILYIVIEIYSE